MFDEEDLRHRTDELARFVRAARTRYGIEARPLVAAGFSNGANIAGSLLLLEPDALDGAILLRGMTPLTPATPPRLAGKRVFLGAGRADPLVRPYESERWAETLRGAGADVTLHWSDTGHALSQGDVDARGNGCGSDSRSVPPGLVAVRDREPAVLAQGARRDADAWRRLAALVFGLVDHANDALHERAVVAHRHDPVHLPVLLDVGAQDRVEHLVGRESVGIELPGAAPPSAGA